VKSEEPVEVTELKQFLKGCKDYAPERAVSQGLCLCKSGTDCPIASHHHNVGALMGIARRIREKPKGDSKAAGKAAGEKKEGKVERWVKCSHERACDCPHGASHFHKGGREVREGEMFVREERASTAESLATAGATLKSILQSVKKLDAEDQLVREDARRESEMWQAEAAIPTWRVEATLPYAKDEYGTSYLDFLSTIETPSDFGCCRVCPRNGPLCDGCTVCRVAHRRVRPSAGALEEKHEKFHPPSRGVDELTYSEVSRICNEISGTEDVAAEFTLSAEEWASLPSPGSPLLLQRQSALPLPPSVEAHYERAAEEEQQQLSNLTVPAEEQRKSVLLNCSPMSQIMVRNWKPWFRGFPLSTLDESGSEDDREPLLKKAHTEIALVEESKAGGGVPGVSPEPTSPARVYAEKAMESARLADEAVARSVAASKAALETVHKIALRKREVLVFYDNLDATVAGPGLGWRLLAKTFLGSLQRKEYVNAPAGATIKESGVQAIKRVEEFYWFWQRNKQGIASGDVSKEVGKHEELSKDDILYFLNFFTHHESKLVYESLCETILRDRKFVARRAVLLEEDGTGVKLARTAILAVDDLISSTPWMVTYSQVVDVTVLANTRAHILNQLLLYGLIARSAVPKAGSKAGVGQGKGEKVKVLFRKGGPIDQRSPQGLPSKSLW